MAAEVMREDMRVTLVTLISRRRSVAVPVQVARFFRSAVTESRIGVVGFR